MKRYGTRCKHNSVHFTYNYPSGCSWVCQSENDHYLGESNLYESGSGGTEESNHSSDSASANPSAQPMSEKVFPPFNLNTFHLRQLLFRVLIPMPMHRLV